MRARVTPCAQLVECRMCVVCADVDGILPHGKFDRIAQRTGIDTPFALDFGLCVPDSLLSDADTGRPKLP